MPGVGSLPEGNRKIWKRILLGPLGDIAEKVLQGERLIREEGVRLAESSDLLALGLMADYVRRCRAGDMVYFINNAHINHTNICKNLCRFCAFGRKAEAPGAFTLTLDEIAAKADEFKDYQPTEVHIVGGLNPALPFSYYQEMLRIVRRTLPDAHIQAFDAVEIDFLAEISGLGVEGVLGRLREAGLGSLPGGGADINPVVRREICRKDQRGALAEGSQNCTPDGSPYKCHHALWSFGKPRTGWITCSGCALFRMRPAALAFIPLSFHPENTSFSPAAPSGFDDLRTVALARLLLDNFLCIKSFWIMLTPNLAQISLAFGANDLMAL